MGTTIAIVILLAAGVYLAAGAVFAIAFLTAGVGRVDHAASQSGWSFRAMIAPGVIALWPVLARKWAASGRLAPPANQPAAPMRAARRRHLLLWLILGPLAAALFAAAMLVRPAPPAAPVVLPPSGAGR